MTATQDTMQPEHPHAAEWIQQHATLWTGRRMGKPIGTIERGRRFTFVDPDGEIRGVYRTLTAAQNAASRA